MIDNSDIKQKLELRKRGMSLVATPSLIVDMYAGEGHISNSMWKHYDNCNLILIEKEQSKANKINFGQVIVGDNRNYLDITKHADIVDCDSYGLVFKLIKDIVSISESQKIIFFTESNPFTKSIYKAIDSILELKPKAFWIEKANNSSVYYGYLII